MSFFRYPGGKRKLGKVLVDILHQQSGECPANYEYREPFWGGGGIGILFVKGNSPERMWINDLDPGISCLWSALLSNPEGIKRRIMKFEPSVDAFDDFSLHLKSKIPDFRDIESVTEYGFMKLVVHQTSYSGLGLKSGGPLGGRNQSSPYKIDCRWSPKYLCAKIDDVCGIMGKSKIRKSRCDCSDFQVLIDDESPALLYLDPPYYEKGSVLYHVSFSVEDHVRMAEALRKTKHRWVLSYDACDEIKELYGWANVERVNVNYSITSTKNSSNERESRWKYEYIITRR